jgi:transposase
MMAGTGTPSGVALERAYQFMLWLMPTIEKFPRSQKFLLGDRMQSASLDILEGGSAWGSLWIQKSLRVIFGEFLVNLTRNCCSGPWIWGQRDSLERAVSRPDGAGDEEDEIGAALKAKIAFEALREQSSVANLAQRYEVHSNQIYACKSSFRGPAARAFAARIRRQAIGSRRSRRNWLCNSPGPQC